MLVTESGIVTLARLVQPKNASSPTVVTSFGMTVFLHPAIKVFEAVSMMALQLFRLSYTVLFVSTVRLSRPAQPLNAPAPLLVTE